jgi:hypothetical protein
MFNKKILLDQARNNPQMQQAIDVIESRIGNVSLTPEIIQEIIDFLELVLSQPDKYPQMRQMVISEKYATAAELPEKFDPMYLGAMLIAFYGLHDRYSQPAKFARGGLAQAVQHVAAQGRGGDSMLAHINPREAEALRRMGGSGAINPNTGIVEFKGGIGKLLGAIAPIVLNFIVPGAGAALGTALGATGVGASILGGALIGGASSALTGGNALQGAVLGGMGGGAGEWLGGATSNALGLDLGATASKALGSGLIGGVMGAATGKGALQGAASGAAGSYLGDTVGGLGSGAIGAGAQGAGSMFGNMMAAGYDAEDALSGAALSGLAAGMGYKGTDDPSWTKPSEAVVDSLKNPAPVSDPYSASNTFDTGTPQSKALFTPAVAEAAVPTPGVPAGLGGAATDTNGNIIGMGKAASASPLAAAGAATQGESGNWLKDMTVDKMAKLTAIASTVTSLMKAPPAIQSAVSALNPQQQAYLNQPAVAWDWSKMQNDANQQGMSLKEYMANNWNKISAYGQSNPATAGQYNMPKGPAIAPIAPIGSAPKQFARGGPLTAFAQGAGSGRDDTIDARLSDGEYVMDAETVALLGDGSNKAGAARLDQMREAIREHKGKSLARGKISADAKMPLAYLKGAK